MPLSLQHVRDGADQAVGVPRGRACLSTAENVRSGMMPPKILVCLTCPAMTACVTPASFSRRMHVPSWPSEIQ